MPFDFSFQYDHLHLRVGVGCEDWAGDGGMGGHFIVQGFIVRGTHGWCLSWGFLVNI